MVETFAPPKNLVATGVSIEEYMDRYAADFNEWVKGDVFKMSPVSDWHDEITGYLREIFRAYFALNPIGRVKSAPFVMRVDAVEIAREPDLQIILDTNPGTFTDTAMIGPADICIEVVSPESVSRDHGQKFEEYEKAGVVEYWIIDPIRRECRFYRLDESGIFVAAQPDDNDDYRTPALPRLALHIPTFWQDELPDIIATVQAVQTMLNAD
jgi:Uma2 family endonuclease